MPSNFNQALGKLMDTGFWKRVGTILTGFVLTDVAVQNVLEFVPDVPFKVTATSAAVTGGLYAVAPSGQLRTDLTLGAGFGTASNFLEETRAGTFLAQWGVSV